MFSMSPSTTSSQVFQSISFWFCHLIYHIVSDGKPSDFCRQIKLMPYYLAHYAFRSLSIAIFFIYMKVTFLKTYFVWLCNISGVGDSCCHCAVDLLQHVADEENLQAAHSNATAAPALLHRCWRYKSKTSLTLMLELIPQAGPLSWFPLCPPFSSRQRRQGAWTITTSATSWPPTFGSGSSLPVLPSFWMWGRTVLV